MFGWGKTRDDSTAIFAATTEARLQSFEQRLTRLEVEVRDMHGNLMELRGKMAVDSHFDQMIERMAAVELSMGDKAHSIGKLEGRIEGIYQILTGMKDALAKSSDQGVAQAAKNITVNTFVADKQGNQIGEGNSQK
jgi:TolA-binding protein